MPGQTVWKNHNKRLQYYRQGLSDAELAGLAKTSVTAIKNWRFKNRLPANRLPPVSVAPGKSAREREIIRKFGTVLFRLNDRGDIKLDVKTIGLIMERWPDILEEMERVA